MSNTVGVEWINNYNNLNQLTHEHEDAGGFYDELVNHDGWIGMFNWGDANAWEDDFKRAAKGGHAHDWVETCDIVYFTGHGSPSGFYFRSDVPDDSLVEADFVSGPTLSRPASGNPRARVAGHGSLQHAPARRQHRRRQP